MHRRRQQCLVAECLGLSVTVRVRVGHVTGFYHSKRSLQHGYQFRNSTWCAHTPLLGWGQGYVVSQARHTSLRGKGLVNWVYKLWPTGM